MPYDLIIPDLHEKIDHADQIVAQFPDARSIIWLGDYWDSFEWQYQPPHWYRVAQWLIRASEDPRNIFLIGNHDQQYYGHAVGQYLCSGYSRTKHGIILELMTARWLTTRCQWVYPVQHGDQLTVLSHAGLHPHHLHWGSAPSVQYFQQLNQQIHDRYAMGMPDPLLMCGRGRGGSGFGGITWQDWNTEFQPLPGVRQVVGHTPHRKPCWYQQDLCLDTHLNHVALMDTQTGVITVQEAPPCNLI
jgi:hypothetical protein